MALSSVRVLIDEGAAQRFPMGLGERESTSMKVPAEGEGCIEYTKTELEALCGSGRVAKMIAVNPEIREAKIITMRTEASGAECAHFVRQALGGVNGKLICVKGTEWKEEEP